MLQCPENHPVCAQCTRRRLKCEWPELYIEQAVKTVEKGTPSMIQQVQLPNPIFTQEDFRLFHHFINEAFPLKPFGNESIWTHEMPSISHNVSFSAHFDLYDLLIYFL